MENDEIIICANCYEENKKGTKYCIHCGNELYYNNSDSNIMEDLETYNEDYFDSSICFEDYIVATNTEQKKIYFYCDCELDKKIDFNNIVDCQIIEDKNNATINLVEKSLLIGTYTTGATREIVKKLQLQIITKDINEPLYTVTLINKTTEKWSKKYKQAIQFAKEVYSLILSITSNNNSSENMDSISQLEKLAELKEKGIITEQEFQESKSKILSKL